MAKKIDAISGNKPEQPAAPTTPETTPAPTTASTEPVVENPTQTSATTSSADANVTAEQATTAVSAEPPTENSNAQEAAPQVEPAATPQEVTAAATPAAAAEGATASPTAESTSGAAVEPTAIPQPLPQASPAESPAATPPATPETFEALFPEPSVVFHGPPTWLWWLLLVLGAAGLGYLGYDITRGRIDHYLTTESPSPSATTNEEVTETASPEASPLATSSAEPTATPEVSPTSTSSVSISLRVLNGTKTSGAAAAAKTTLTAAGYTVRTIGNATNSYSTTYVYYATGYKEQADAIKEALGNSNAIVQESTLASPDQVLVVIGTK